MHTMTISAKFHVVIPKALREELSLRPGQRVQAVAIGNRIQLIPERPIRELKGFLPHLDPEVERGAVRGVVDPPR